jgi:hypothetical protein
MYVQVFSRPGKYIRSVFLQPGDFRNGQIDRESFTGQSVESFLSESLLQRWQEFARPFIHPKNAIGQGAIVLIERDKCLTLVRDAKRLQPFNIYLTHSLSNGVSHGNPP